MDWSFQDAFIQVVTKDAPAAFLWHILQAVTVEQVERPDSSLKTRTVRMQPHNQGPTLLLRKCAH